MKIVKKQQLITADDILAKISEYDIYRYYFGNFFINKITNNHLRGEKTPSFIIGNKLGGLSHFDFGDKRWRGNCFNLVQQIKYCNFDTALKTIDQDFGLGLFKNSVVQTSDIIKWKEPKISKIAKLPTIQVIVRKTFTNKELDYWAEYFQTEEDLREENVFVPKSIYINGERKKLYEKELTFCYFSPEIKKWKIYCPESPEISFIKNGKKQIINKKWYSNVPFNYIEHMEKVHNCNNAFIAKSRKDRMVLKKALKTDAIIVTQAEDPACFTESNIARLKANSQQQITVFDNDKKGKESSLWLTENHNFKHCNVPDKYINRKCSDFADLAKRYGLNRVRSHFKEKKLI